MIAPHKIGWIVHKLANILWTYKYNAIIRTIYVTYDGYRDNHNDQKSSISELPTLVIPIVHNIGQKIGADEQTHFVPQKIRVTENCFDETIKIGI